MVNVFSFLLVSVHLAGPSSGYAQVWSTTAVHDIAVGSIASRAQLITLSERLSLGKPSRAEVVSILNRHLRELALPLINADSVDLDVGASYSRGVVPFLNGYDIVDGTHRFCLPCEIGHNSFVFGLVPWAKAKRDADGQFYSLINAIDETQWHTRNGEVNSRFWPEVRRALFVVDKDPHRGVLVIQDDGIEFFATQLSPAQPKQSLFSKLLGEKPAPVRGTVKIVLSTSNGDEVPVQIHRPKDELVVAYAKPLITSASNSATEDRRARVAPTPVSTPVGLNLLLDVLHASARVRAVENLGCPDYLGTSDHQKLIQDMKEKDRMRRCRALAAYLKIDARTFDADDAAANRFLGYRSEWSDLARELNCLARD